jgi:carbohydrate kinase (thermoresistant glucokinase family)
LALATAHDERVVFACSALKMAYRLRFLGAAPCLAFIYLKGDRELFAAHLGHRSGHFMPPTLLDSQLDVLEEPILSEPAIVVDASQGLDDELSAVLAKLPASFR